LEFTTTCPKPGCGWQLLTPIWPTQTGPQPAADEKPDAVKCAAGHEFAVLNYDLGHSSYELGNELKRD
jgi:hypothetical protein